MRQKLVGALLCLWVGVAQANEDGLVGFVIGMPLGAVAGGWLGVSIGGPIGGLAGVVPLRWMVTGFRPQGHVDVIFRS